MFVLIHFVMRLSEVYEPSVASPKNSDVETTSFKNRHPVFSSVNGKFIFNRYPRTAPGKISIF